MINAHTTFKVLFEDENKEECIRVLKARIVQLFNDYSQPVEDIELNYVCNRIFSYLKGTSITPYQLEQIFGNIIENYTTYRKINTAVICTAITKFLID